MNAARILREARDAGLSLGLSPAGRIAYRGPADLVALFRPALLENRDAIIEALAAEAAPAATPATFPETAAADARASVEAMRDAMAAETAARRDWHKQPVDGWRVGRLEWRNVVTGETTVIRFPKPKGGRP
jgi:hypothetical protein